MGAVRCHPMSPTRFPSFAAAVVAELCSVLGVLDADVATVALRSSFVCDFAEKSRCSADSRYV